jgi:hypothetical protein
MRATPGGCPIGLLSILAQTGSSRTSTRSSREPTSTREIADAVASCQVLLALIGNGWHKVKDTDGRRRLTNPKDYVRLEIEAALSCDIRVIPILVDGAKMPRADQLPSSLAEFARHQGLELSPDRDRYDFDVGRLLKTLDKTFKKLQNARTFTPMQGQPLSPLPASAKPVPLDEIIAKLSPSERAAVEKIEDPQQRAIQILQMHLEKEKKLQTVLDNIEQMRRDMRKAVTQNKFRAD